MMRLKEQNQSSQDLMYDILMTFQSYKGFILGDQGADSGGKGKSKWRKKDGANFSLNHFFPTHLDFPLPPLSAPRSPRMEGFF